MYSAAKRPYGKAGGLKGSRKQMPGGWAKYEFPETQLSGEHSSKKMSMSEDQAYHILRKKAQLLSQSPELPERERQAWARQLVEMETTDTKNQINREFIQEFIKWLGGRSSFNAKNQIKTTLNDQGKVTHVRAVEGCPWGNKPLTFLPGVAEFLDQGPERRGDVIKELTKLKMHGPRNIDEAWIYYKYLIRQAGIDEHTINELNFLSPYDYPSGGKDNNGSPITYGPGGDPANPPPAPRNDGSDPFDEQRYLDDFFSLILNVRDGEFATMNDIEADHRWQSLRGEDQMEIAGSQILHMSQAAAAAGGQPSSAPQPNVRDTGLGPAERVSTQVPKGASGWSLGGLAARLGLRRKEAPVPVPAKVGDEDVGDLYDDSDDEEFFDAEDLEEEFYDTEEMTPEEIIGANSVEPIQKFVFENALLFHGLGVEDLSHFVDVARSFNPGETEAEKYLDPETQKYNRERLVKAMRQIFPLFYSKHQGDNGGDLQETKMLAAIVTRNHLIRSEIHRFMDDFSSPGTDKEYTSWISDFLTAYIVSYDDSVTQQMTEEGMRHMGQFLENNSVRHTEEDLEDMFAAIGAFRRRFPRGEFTIRNIGAAFRALGVWKNQREVFEEEIASRAPRSPVIVDSDEEEEAGPTPASEPASFDQEEEQHKQNEAALAEAVRRENLEQEKGRVKKAVNEALLAFQYLEDDFLRVELKKAALEEDQEKAKRYTTALKELYSSREKLERYYKQWSAQPDVEAKTLKQMNEIIDQAIDIANHTHKASLISQAELEKKKAKLEDLQNTIKRTDPEDKPAVTELRKEVSKARAFEEPLKKFTVQQMAKNAKEKKKPLRPPKRTVPLAEPVREVPGTPNASQEPERVLLPDSQEAVAAEEEPAVEFVKENPPPPKKEEEPEVEFAKENPPPEVKIVKESPSQVAEQLRKGKISPVEAVEKVVIDLEAAKPGLVMKTVGALMGVAGAAFEKLKKPRKAASQPIGDGDVHPGHVEQALIGSGIARTQVDKDLPPRQKSRKKMPKPGRIASQMVRAVEEGRVSPQHAVETLSNASPSPLSFSPNFQQEMRGAMRTMGFDDPYYNEIPPWSSRHPSRGSRKSNPINPESHYLGSFDISQDNEPPPPPSPAPSSQRSNASQAQPTSQRVVIDLSGVLRPEPEPEFMDLSQDLREPSRPTKRNRPPNMGNVPFPVRSPPKRRRRAEPEEDDEPDIQFSGEKPPPPKQAEPEIEFTKENPPPEVRVVKKKKVVGDRVPVGEPEFAPEGYAQSVASQGAPRPAQQYAAAQNDVLNSHIPQETGVSNNYRRLVLLAGQSRNIAKLGYAYLTDALTYQFGIAGEESATPEGRQGAIFTQGIKSALEKLTSSRNDNSKKEAINELVQEATQAKANIESRMSELDRRTASLEEMALELTVVSLAEVKSKMANSEHIKRNMGNLVNSLRDKNFSKGSTAFDTVWGFSHSVEAGLSMEDFNLKDDNLGLKLLATAHRKALKHLSKQKGSAKFDEANYNPVESTKQLEGFLRGTYQPPAGAKLPTGLEGQSPIWNMGANLSDKTRKTFKKVLAQEGGIKQFSTGSLERSGVTGIFAKNQEEAIKSPGKIWVHQSPQTDLVRSISESSVRTRSRTSRSSAALLVNSMQPTSILLDTAKHGGRAPWERYSKKYIPKENEEMLVLNNLTGSQIAYAYFRTIMDANRGIASNTQVLDD